MNIDILINRSIDNIAKSNLSNLNINNLILELEDINNYKLTSKINITFIRKN